MHFFFFIGCKQIFTILYLFLRSLIVTLFRKPFDFSNKLYRIFDRREGGKMFRKRSEVSFHCEKQLLLYRH